MLDNPRAAEINVRPFHKDVPVGEPACFGMQIEFGLVGMDVVLAHTDEHVAFQVHPVRRSVIPGEIGLQDIVPALENNPALRFDNGVVAQRSQLVGFKVP